MEVLGCIAEIRMYGNLRRRIGLLDINGLLHCVIDPMVLHPNDHIEALLSVLSIWLPLMLSAPSIDIGLCLLFAVESLAVRVRVV
jgi:hypothetical protein